MAKERVMCGCGIYFPPSLWWTLLVLCPDVCFCVSISKLLCPLLLLADSCHLIQKTTSEPPEPLHPAQAEKWESLGDHTPRDYPMTSVRRSKPCSLALRWDKFRSNNSGVWFHSRKICEVRLRLGLCLNLYLCISFHPSLTWFQRCLQRALFQ